MTDPILAAELAQARRLVANAMNEREGYVRLVACLARALETGAAVATVDGHVAVKVSAMDAVPKAWRVEVRRATVKSESAEPNAPDEEMLVVVVSQKDGANGVAVPEKPRLVVPNGGA